VILVLWVAMEVGKKVVVLYNGGRGGVTHFAEALGSEATALQRVVSRFPWKDSSGEGKGSSEIVHFKDHTGETQVSLIVIREEVPASACGRVVHELFHYLLSNAPIQSPDFCILLPAILRMPGSTVEVDSRSKNVNIFTAFVNGTPENTGTWDHLPKLPPTFTLRDGILAYMIHYAHATGLPTQLLVGPSPQGVAAPNNESIEALHMLGDVVGRHTGLPFSKQNPAKVGNLAPMLDSVEDDWRRLYI